MGVKKLFAFLNDHFQTLSTKHPFSLHRSSIDDNNNTTGTGVNEGTNHTATNHHRSTIVVDAFSLWITLAAKAEALRVAAAQEQQQHTAPSSPADGRSNNGGRRGKNFFGEKTSMGCIEEDEEEASLELPYFHDVDLIGGDCFSVAVVFRHFLHKMCEELHFDLVFVVDAPRGIDGPTSERDKVWEQRQKETQQLTFHHYRYAVGKEAKKTPKQHHLASKPVLPYLLFANLKAVITEFQQEQEQKKSLMKGAVGVVEQLVLDTEVDEQIGQILLRYHADFLISGDTDMLITPIHVPVLLVQHLPWRELLSCRNNDTGCCGACQASASHSANICSSSSITSVSSVITFRALSHQKFAQFLWDLSLTIDDQEKGASSSTVVHPDFLLTVASLCGNDITASVCDEGSVDSVAKKVIAYFTKNNGGKIIDTEEDLGEGKDEKVLGLDDESEKEKKKARLLSKKPKQDQRIEKLLQHPCVLQSVERYHNAANAKSSSSSLTAADFCRKTLTRVHRSGTNDKVDDTVNTTTHPLFHLLHSSSDKRQQKEREALQEFLSLYSSGEISAHFLPLLLFDVVFHRLEPWTPAVGCSMQPIPTLPTFLHVENVIKMVFQNQRQFFSGASIASSTSTNADKNATGKSAPCLLPSSFCWHNVCIADDDDDKTEMKKKIFNAAFSFRVAKEVRKNLRETSSSHTFLLDFNQAVLWLVHPTIHQQELFILSAMMVVMKKRKQDPKGWLKLMRKICTSDLLDERPLPRTLELAHIITSAYGTVAGFIQLFQLNEDLQKINVRNNNHDNRKNAGGGIVLLPSPECFYSGTLLHCLCSMEPCQWMKELELSVLAPIMEMVRNAEQHILKEYPEIAVSSCLAKLSKITLSESKKEIETEQDGVKTTPFLFGSPPVSKFSSKWIGILHRDELVEMLDEGSTCNVVDEGGKLFKINNRQQTAPTASIQGASGTTVSVTETSNPLPILKHMDEILKAIDSQNVVCIQGETGCGKSSMIPLHLYLDAKKRGVRVDILVTQPRRIAATSLAKRVASLLGEEVGETVGYRIGGGKEFHRESRKTCIRFVTTGYLLEAFVNSSSLFHSCTHILLDEVHERTLQADMLSLVVKLMMLPDEGPEEEEEEPADDDDEEVDGMSAKEEGKVKTKKDKSSKQKHHYACMHPNCQRISMSWKTCLQHMAKCAKLNLEPGKTWALMKKEKGLVEKSREKGEGIVSTFLPPSDVKVLQKSAATAHTTQRKVQRKEKEKESDSNQRIPDEILASTIPHRQCPLQQRLVVMSATIQADLFRSYFRPLVGCRHIARGCHCIPTLQVGARRCKVDELFLDEALEKFQSQLPADVNRSLQSYLAKVKTAKSMTAFALRGDAINAVADLTLTCVAPGTCILVFLPGLDEIENVLEAISNITKKMKRMICTLRLFALHSIVDIDEQQKIVAETSASECKIVLATNIAETSITIPDVKVVIDVGMSRRMAYDEAKKIRALICGWCSQSAAKQRSGRAGRVSDGIVIKMYTRPILQDVMPEFDQSEFLPLEYSVLQVREHLAGYGCVEEVMQKLIEPPPATAVREALDRLIQWGALGLPPDYEVSELGHVALQMPIDVGLTKAVLTGASFGCAAEMIIIAAGLTLQRPLLQRPLRNFFDNDTDFIQMVCKVMKTMHYFDRQNRSDVHLFLSVYEEFAQCRRWEVSKSLDVWAIAPKQIGTFLKYTKQLASSLLRNNIALQEDDEGRIEWIANPPLPSSSNIEFPIFQHDVANMLFQLGLASSAEVLHVSQRSLNGTVLKKSSSNLSSLPFHQAATRQILFDGASEELLALEPKTLQLALAQVMNLRSPDLLKVTQDSARKAVTVEILATSSPLGMMATATERDDKNAILTIDSNKSTVAKEIENEYEQQRQQMLSQEANTTTSKRKRSKNISAEILENEQFSCHHLVHALHLLPRLHPSRQIVIPMAKDQTEGMKFPSTCCPANLKKVKGYRESVDDQSGVNFDRWSILNGPADCQDGPPWMEVGFSFGATASSFGAKSLNVSANLAVWKSRNFQFLAVMASSAMLQTAAEAVQNILLGEKATTNHQQDKDKSAGEISILQVIPNLSLAVGGPNNEYILGSNPQKIVFKHQLRQAEGGNRKEGKGKNESKIWEDDDDDDEDDDLSDIAHRYIDKKKQKQNRFQGILGFTAPLHMLVEVNIIWSIIALSKKPKECLAVKRKLSLLLEKLLQQQDERNEEGGSGKRGSDHHTNNRNSALEKIWPPTTGSYSAHPSSRSNMPKFSDMAVPFAAYCMNGNPDDHNNDDMKKDFVAQIDLSELIKTFPAEKQNAAKELTLLLEKARTEIVHLQHLHRSHHHHFSPATKGYNKKSEISQYGGKKGEGEAQQYSSGNAGGINQRHFLHNSFEQNATTTTHRNAYSAAYNPVKYEAEKNIQILKTPKNSDIDEDDDEILLWKGNGGAETQATCANCLTPTNELYEAVSEARRYCPACWIQFGYCDICSNKKGGVQRSSSATELFFPDLTSLRLHFSSAEHMKNAADAGMFSRGRPPVETKEQDQEAGEKFFILDGEQEDDDDDDDDDEKYCPRVHVCNQCHQQHPELYQAVTEPDNAWYCPFCWVHLGYCDVCREEKDGKGETNKGSLSNVRDVNLHFNGKKHLNKVEGYNWQKRE